MSSQRFFFFSAWRFRAASDFSLLLTGYWISPLSNIPCQLLPYRIFLPVLPYCFRFSRSFLLFVPFISEILPYVRDSQPILLLIDQPKFIFWHSRIRFWCILLCRFVTNRVQLCTMGLNVLLSFISQLRSVSFFVYLLFLLPFRLTFSSFSPCRFPNWASRSSFCSSTCSAWMAFIS